MFGFELLVQIALLVAGVYQLVLSVWGWRVRRRIPKHAPKKTFAILVAAHNEAHVVGALLENLKRLDYPRSLYDIFVICDNCTDDTASIARKHGVIAMERQKPHLRGKGHAIEWMLTKLWARRKQYDAVVMFDADNLVAPDYLRHMNDDLCNGARVIQAYLDTKNPNDSWVTAAYAITYWYCNRLWQMPRKVLKMANFLGGTGMCFETKLLREMGWGATSLVEDLEFTMRCVQRGIYPVLNYDAKVYDEKPVTFRASVKQRLRWMQGHFDVARRYFFPLLWAGIRERKWTKIDTAFYSVTVYNVFFGFLVTIVQWLDQGLGLGLAWASIYEVIPVMVASVLFILICSQFIIAITMEKGWSKKMVSSLFAFPIFMLSWYPITFYAFFTQRNKQWSHTQHSRVVTIEEIRSRASG